MRSNINQSTIVLIVPTYKPGEIWKEWLENLITQDLKPDAIINIDSSSADGTKELSIKNGLKVLEIPKKDFNHAGTRNHAALYAKQKYDADILIFLTQDAILADIKSIDNIVAPFENPKIAAVYGRQLPNSKADPVAQHSRLFNYRLKSFMNTQKEINEKGIKAAFMSNSFAAYRYNAYKACGGFPKGLIFGEDMFLAARMLLNGFFTYYSAEAVVKHSHNYSLREEFRRYFDIGVFHSSQPFLLDNFGSVSGEGVKFALSEFRYCFEHGGVFWAINSILRTGLKFIGYKLGSFYRILPNWVNRNLSMDKNYWK